MKDCFGRELKIGQICFFDKYVDAKVLVLITAIKGDKITYIELPYTHVCRWHISVGNVRNSTIPSKFAVTRDFEIELIVGSDLHFAELTDRISGNKEFLKSPDINDGYVHGDAVKLKKAIDQFVKKLGDIPS